MKWMKAKLGTKRRLLVVFVVVTLAGAGGFWMWGGNASAAEYLTARVERGNLRNTVTATGTVQAVTTVQVGSQASGTISALYADFNSVVKKGQVIAQLDPSTAQAKASAAGSTAQNQLAGVTSAEANVSVLKAQLDDAASVLKQEESLLRGGVISQREDE